MAPKRREDIVLVSGLINIHRFGKKFLHTLASTWKDGKIYIVYTNANTKVTKMNIGNKEIYRCGANNYRSGSDSVTTQAMRVTEKVRMLQADHGLSEHFHMVGHSMGGLVCRQYIYDNPNKVLNLITLGTPNAGSPLANFYHWLSYLIGAKKAFANLTPEWVAAFNERCPIQGAPLYEGGHIYTVRGYMGKNPFKHFGVLGEVLLAGITLRLVYKVRSDGLVPEASVLANGAIHLGDFPHFNHLHLARNPRIAEAISEVLFQRDERKKVATGSP